MSPPFIFVGTVPNAKKEPSLQKTKSVPLCMSIETCPHCGTIFSYRKSLNRHILKYHQEMERGRATERGDEPGARKKSKSRERGDTNVDALYEDLTQDAFDRMMKDGAESAVIYNGMPPQVQTALQNRFLEERMDFQREKDLFEAKQRVHARLEAVFGPILFGVPATTTATTAPATTTASGFNILGFGNR